MKKLVTIVLTVLLLVSFVSCGSKKTADTPETQQTEVKETEVKTVEQKPETTEQKTETASSSQKTTTGQTASAAKKDSNEPDEFADIATFSVAPIENFNGKASITVWYSISGENGDFFKSQVEKFAAEHPQFSIETTYTGSYADSATKISAAKLSGKAPDMIITSAAQLYPGEDGNVSMEVAIQDPEFNKDDIQPGIMAYTNYMGHTCAVPFAISTQVMYYNKDLVKKAGYDLENNPPKTWEEFITVAKAIADASGNKKIKGFDTSDAKWLFKTMLYQNENRIVQVKAGKIVPVFDTESAVEVATYWKRLVDEKVMAIGQHDNAENKFLSGQLVFIAATSGRCTKWQGNTTFEIGAIEMPCFKRQGVALGGSTATVMTTDQEKFTACWELIKYLLNTENQADFALTSGYLPIRKSSLELDSVKKQFEKNEMYEVAAKQLDYSFAYTHFGEMGSMDMIITYGIDDIENGSDPYKVLKSSVDELLGDLK